MKVLFLGNVAADTAKGIKAELPHGLRVVILAEPQDLSRAPEVSADADILVTNPAIARAWSRLTCRPVSGVGPIACDPKSAVCDSSRGFVATSTARFTMPSVACATSQTKPSRWQTRITDVFEDALSEDE